MTKTYAQVMKQIDMLKREADEIRRKDVEGVITRIKDAIRVYGLTANDLGLGPARSARSAKAAPKRRGKGAKAAATVKFRDDAGNIWGGRGPRPAWLRAALSAGKQLSDFAV